MEQLIFWFFCILLMVSGLFSLFSRNLVHSAFWLLLVLLSVAALFVFSGAEYIAIAQILVYAAGVVVLIIFGVMLSTRLVHEKAGAFIWGNRWSSYILSLSLTGLFIWIIMSSVWEAYHLPDSNEMLFSTSDLGRMLVTTYAFPFELVGLLLLVVIVNSALIAGEITKES